MRLQDLYGADYSSAVQKRNDFAETSTSAQKHLNDSSGLDQNLTKGQLNRAMGEMQNHSGGAGARLSQIAGLANARINNDSSQLASSIDANKRNYLEKRIAEENAKAATNRDYFHKGLANFADAFYNGAKLYGAKYNGDDPITKYFQEKTLPALGKMKRDFKAIPAVLKQKLGLIKYNPAIGGE